MTISTTKAASAVALIPAVMAVAASAAQAAPSLTVQWKSGGAGCNNSNLKIENINGQATATSQALCSVFLGVPPFGKIKVTLKAPGATTPKIGWADMSVGTLFDGSLASIGTAQVSTGGAVKGNYQACTAYANSKTGPGVGTFYDAKGASLGSFVCVTGPIK